MVNFDKAFGTELGEIIAERAEAAVLHDGAQGGGHVRMDFTGAEGAGRGDLGEAHQGVHQSQLPGIVEPEAGNALARGGEGWFGELLELAAIDEGLEDIRRSWKHWPIGFAASASTPKRISSATTGTSRRSVGEAVPLRPAIAPCRSRRARVVRSRIP
jgi:hypothetical protein